MAICEKFKCLNGECREMFTLSLNFSSHFGHSRDIWCSVIVINGPVGRNLMCLINVSSFGPPLFSTEILYPMFRVISHISSNNQVESIVGRIVIIIGHCQCFPFDFLLISFASFHRKLDATNRI